MVHKITGPWDGHTSDEPDTEAHGFREQFPVPPNSGAGDSGSSLGSDSETDTEGHLQARRSPGEGVRVEPDLVRLTEDDEPDTEGHLAFRRRPGEGGE